MRQESERVEYSPLTVLHQKLVSIWNVGQTWWDGETGGEEKTFDVVIKVASKHFVPQFRNPLDDRHLDYIIRVSADSRLTKTHEGKFHR